tara:strand:+ start:4172 stop:4822 length:651 start_codon:yes stop_codon:yes gene_type:complete
MTLYNFKNRLLTSLGLLLLVFLIFEYSIFLLSALLVFGIFSLVEFFEINKKISKNNLLELTRNLIFILFIFTFCTLFFLFSNIVQFKLILFILLFGCIGSDIGGFIIGKVFKGPKLTKISPKKTISGSLGSILFTTIIISFLFFYFFKIFNLNIVIISIITSLACQTGDLFFSYLKRKAKMKDTGNILPGHGGILDRLDGVFLGIPAGFISLIILY